MYKKSWMSPEEIDENYQQLMNSLKHYEEFIELKVRKSDIQDQLLRLRAAIENEFKEYVEDLPQLEVRIAEANAVAKILSERLMKQNQLLLKHAVNKVNSKVQQSTHEAQQIVDLFQGTSPHPSSKVLPSIVITNEKNQPICKPSSNKELLDNSCFLTPNKNMPLPAALNSLHKLVLTGSNKISINQYKGSPLVKRKLRTPLKFSEFEVELKQQHFDKIPKYLRGRETLADLNQFLEQTIVPCFNEKYQLLYRERASIRHPNDLELWKVYKDQVSLLPGECFITPGDISRYINRLLDKKMQNRIVLLRQVGLLQEKRISQTVCYIWNKNFK